MLHQDTGRLRHDVRRRILELDRLVDDLAERGKAGVDALPDRLRDGLGTMRMGLLDLEDEAVMKARRAGRHLASGARQHPWATTGAIVAVVATAAWLASRRRRG